MMTSDCPQWGRIKRSVAKADDFRESLLMELFNIQANRIKSTGFFMEQFKCKPLPHSYIDRVRPPVFKELLIRELERD
jgi:CelD/BcsL family acetyltransferase involved in cellulose biosynthesis